MKNLFRNRIFLLVEPSHVLSEFFKKHGGITHSNPYDYFDAVVFGAGSDISPFLYGQTPHAKTNFNYRRDARENFLYRQLPTYVPKIGIGRGAQLLNVLAGGSIYQHCPGHGVEHHVCDIATGQMLLINSFHHQQMNLPINDAIVVLSAAAVSNVKETDTQYINIDLTKKNVYTDVEAAWFDDSKIFAFQGRPEIKDNKKSTQNTEELFMQYMDDWVLKDMKKLVRLTK